MKSTNRRLVLDWLEQGRLPEDAVPRALSLAGVTPTPVEWRAFLDRLTLWSGAASVAFGLIFFFAYNWEALGRYFKFGIVEALLLISVVASARLGLDRASGRAALLVTMLLVGALLALVGQTYQTGADTFELFALWALAILPLVAVGRTPIGWLLFVALLNLATAAYYQTFGSLFGFFFRPDRLLWVVFALNTAALGAWELTAQAGGVAWLRERWGPRVLATASGTCVTWLAFMGIVEHSSANLAGFFAEAVWLGVAYVVYRHVLRDVFVLAGGVLSAIIVIATFLGKNLLHHDNAGAFLFIGLVVIGLSGAAGYWLRRVAAEEAT